MRPGDLIHNRDGRTGLVTRVELGPGNIGELCVVAVIDGVEQHVFAGGMSGWSLFLKRPRTTTEIHEEEIEYMRDKLLASIQVSARDLAVYGNAYVHPVEESTEDSLKLKFTSPSWG